MHFRLFDRPLIVDDPLSAIYIDGQYDDYTPGEAYEGRVQIHGSVGKCTVEILDSNLPPGAYAYVDNVFKEVVVKWPVYTPPVDTFTLLENGDFSEGDTGSWTNTGEGNPFVIEPDSDGNMSMKFKSGFSGGHFSRSPLAPVSNINRQITLKGQIAQGKSSKKKLLGGLLLCWFDKDRNITHWNESNWIMSGGGYQEAKITAAASRVDTKFVAAQVHFHRNGQNHPGWADNIQWDHVWTKGYDSDETLFVRVRVTDALNNSAEHYGTIDELSIWLTSKLYPLYAEETFGQMGVEPSSFRRGYGIGDQLDSMMVYAPKPLTLARRRMLQQLTADPVSWQINAPKPLSFARKKMLIQYNAGVESFGYTLVKPVQFIRKKHPYIRNAQEGFVTNNPVPTKLERKKP